ncbi:MAG: 2-hydroxychromene-2-carboxylate isomerase [Betaproteobacteria bacterium]|jgi:2-hydroxychromene-2-carboxylate isomerase|nr:2-hydroxychromene-2-carboxylate isomerase [Pseudomonadota bacterium]NBO94997.1 2-hydroxychromene-2-carboxylate isomerase [Betaproteobacteria bacterium]NBP35879.1 2-hydroxychromene-2-carboxylate isomerase [Betaproteobacteria bacterium]NBP37648.1 2-hydroxychromene-2-carboxylate isomerase [Betaproteobacteria bacterium]NBQ77649.1 2-hydroxychromene-2-carboxylate isomerase [Betaproteobacteria bacterium]
MHKFCEYYFVCTSPWTYLGHQRFVAMAEKYQIEVRVKPMNLGQIFPASGGLPLAKRATQRQTYRLFELERWRQWIGLPLNIHPKYFPADDRLAARCVIAANESLGSKAALALAGAMLKAVWADEANIADEQDVRQVIEKLSMNADELLTGASTDAAHARYEANTQEALQAQVFGAPWYIFEAIPYWGQDRLDFLERAFAASQQA